MSYEKISPPVASEFPDEWYDMNRESHFWFAWRLNVLQRLLSAAGLSTTAPLRAFDIGCGDGSLRLQVEAVTSWCVDGADLNESALEKASPSRGRTMLYNIENRREELKEHYDIIFLLDVIEHLDDPETFLSAAGWHLKQGGVMVVNVPALPALYSRYDQLVGHFKRYTAKSIRKLFESGFPEAALVDIRYWGFSLVPVVWIRKMVLRTLRTPKQAVQFGFKTPAPGFNSFFKTMMHLETTVLHHPLVGSSLMSLARKKPSA